MIRTGWECTEDKFLVEILKYNDNESKTTFPKIYMNLLGVCEGSRWLQRYNSCDVIYLKCCSISKIAMDSTL